MPNAKPSLEDIQKWLQEAVTSEGQMTPEAASIIEVSPKGPTTQERLAVYADGWFLRLEDVLRGEYPKLSEKLGSEAWSELAQNFIRQHPSTTYDINRAGDALPAFLIERYPKYRKTWMGELALLESEISKIRGVVDSEVWNVEELQTMTMDGAEKLRFEIVPGVRLIHFEWNVDEIKWSDAKPINAPRPLVIYRQEFAPTYEDLTPDELRFLERIQEKPLLTDLIPEFDGTAWMQWLARFAACGVIRRIN